MALYGFAVTEQTIVADDKEGGAFGPGARDLKIKNLRMYPFISI